MGNPLYEDWKDKTLVVLNNDFDSAAGKTRAAEQFAAQQLLKACADRDIGVLISGNSGDGGSTILGDALIPTHDVDYSTIQRFGNISEFGGALKEFKKFVRSEGEQGRNPFPSDVSNVFSQIEYNKWRFWGEPKKEHLELQAAKLSKKIDQMFPEQRWVVVSRFSPEDAGKGFLGMGRNWKLGKLEVRRTLDTASGTIAALHMSNEQVHNPEVIKSRLVKTALFLSVKFENELEILSHILNHDRLPGEDRSVTNSPKALETAEVITESVMTDLFNEQAAMRNAVFRGGLSKQDILVRMPKMRKLVKMMSKTNIDTEFGKQIAVELVARINHMTRSQVSWYEHLVSMGRSKRVRQAALSLSSELVKGFFGEMPGWFSKSDYLSEAENRSDADARIINREKELTADATRVYDGPQQTEGIAFDPEFANPSSRVLTGSQFDEIAERERQRGINRQDFESKSAAAKAALLCPQLKAALLCPQLKAALENLSPSKY